MDRVVDEHEPHRPIPGPWFGKLVPGPEESRQRHDRGGEPDDHPDGQDPRRGSQRHHDEARNADGQPDVPHPEGPDSQPPVSVVLQFQRLVHATIVPPLPGRCQVVLHGSSVVPISHGRAGGWDHPSTSWRRRSRTRQGMNQGIQQHSTRRGPPQPMSTDSSGTLHKWVFIEPPPGLPAPPAAAN